MPTFRSLDVFPPSLDLRTILAAKSAALPRITGAESLLTSLHATRAVTSNLTDFSPTVNVPASVMKNLPSVKDPLLPLPDIMGSRMSKLDSLLPGLSPGDSLAFRKTLIGRSAAASALDTFSKTVAGFNDPTPTKAFLSTPAKSALFGMAPARAGATSVIGLGLTSFPWQLFRFDPANGPMASLFGTPCVHEHACIRCPVLRPDPEQMPRLEEIHANLHDRLQEAKEQGWLGEVAAIEASLAAAEQKLAAMRDLAAKHTTVHLGMPDFRTTAGRLIPEPAKEE